MRMAVENWRFGGLFFSEEPWLAWLIDTSVSNIFASGSGCAIAANKRYTITRMENSIWFCDISGDKTLWDIDGLKVITVTEHFGHIGDISSIPAGKIDGNYPGAINKIGHVGNIGNIKIAEIQ